MIYQYKDLTEDLKEVSSGVKKVKTSGGASYVELKCSDIEDDHSDAEESNNNLALKFRDKGSHDINYSDLGFAAFGITGRAVVDLSLLTSQIGREGLGIVKQ